MDVNLSADQLADPGLPGEVLALISRTGVDPRRVVLEITETALVRDMETVLRRLGQLSAHRRPAGPGRLRHRATPR